MASLADRPPLGFEYEIALAKVDTSRDMSFSESPYPAIIGQFEIITCTREQECTPPANQAKFIRCGYNPAAHIIPDATVLGSLSFEALDRASLDNIRPYIGALCVARLVARLDANTVRTWFASYFTPRARYRSNGSDDPGVVGAEGNFSLLYSQ